MAARKCVPEVAKKKNGNGNGEAVRKKVSIPLQIFVEGKNKAAAAEDFDSLVEVLTKNLPIKYRLGRGKLTTISVEARA